MGETSSADEIVRITLNDNILFSSHFWTLIYFELIQFATHIQRYKNLFLNVQLFFWVSGYKFNGLINFNVHLPDVCFILFWFFENKHFIRQRDFDLEI